MHDDDDRSYIPRSSIVFDTFGGLVRDNGKEWLSRTMRLIMHSRFFLRIAYCTLCLGTEGRKHQTKFVLLLCVPTSVAYLNIDCGKEEYIRR